MTEPRWKHMDQGTIVTLGEKLHLVTSVLYPDGTIDLLIQPNRADAVPALEGAKFADLMAAQTPDQIVLRFSHPDGLLVVLDAIHGAAKSMSDQIEAMEDES